MPTPPKQNGRGPRTPDGDGYKLETPVPQTRSDVSYLDFDRVANGGLTDDPTESGEPVRNRRSHGPLTGGR